MTQQSVAADETAVQPEQRPVWFDAHRGKREVRLRSRRRARVTAAAVAGVVAVSLVRWGWVSAELAGRDDLNDSWSWLAGVQLAIAIPGIIVGVVALAYVTLLAVTGTTWRRWREVAGAFFAFVVAWGAVYALGAIVF